MVEPVSSTTATGATGAAAAVAAAGWWSGLDAGVVIGAFAGAVFFVISSTELTVKARAGFFIVSFMAGILAARTAAEIITLLLPTKSQAPEPLGALIAAAVAIQLLTGLTTKNMAKRLLGGLGGVIASSIVNSKKGSEKDE